MQPLLALLVAAVAACAIARPPGPTAPPPPPRLQLQSRPLPLPLLVRPPPPPPELLGDYLLPRFLIPRYLSYEDSPRLLPATPKNDWLNKEIYRINQMEEEEDLVNPYDVDVIHWIAQDSYLSPGYESPVIVQETIDYAFRPVKTNIEEMLPLEVAASEITPPELQPNQQEIKRGSEQPKTKDNDSQKNSFALSPLYNKYFEHTVNPNIIRTPTQTSYVHHEGGEPRAAPMLEPPRQTRQNPNLSKQKNLLGPELGRLKTGLTNRDYRIPVSLLPSNLRWLKISQLDDDDESSVEGDGSGDPTDHPRHIHVLETATVDPADSMYGVALVAAIGAALTIAVVGFAFGWYTLSKKAKAAADVDYPAYGVTGPTIDTSGDRKLAHSAHMYHYQHQKQQILAMERNGLEQRTGSVSDPESEEENEEGDYTVYECPGFATTGDMEVKNPLFSDDPTPATPGKLDVTKPQPKDKD